MGISWSLDMAMTPLFEFDRCDTYMYFASNMLPDNPVIVEVGSIRGAHGVKLCEKFKVDGEYKLTMIAYEAGKENYATLCDGISHVFPGSGGVFNRPIIPHRAAVTGTDGEVEFFEFEEISSNSIYPRHEGEGRRLRRTSRVKSVGLDTIMRDNDCSRIDLLFLNCEGAELGVLEEVLASPTLMSRLGQLCVSFHGGRVYPQGKTTDIVQRMSDFFWVVEEQNDWPCHLFVNKELEL
jgi:FkbM family methyltransferase